MLAQEPGCNICGSEPVGKHYKVGHSTLTLALGPQCDMGNCQLTPKPQVNPESNPNSNAAAASHPCQLAATGKPFSCPYPAQAPQCMDLPRQRAYCASALATGGAGTNWSLNVVKLRKLLASSLTVLNGSAQHTKVGCLLSTRPHIASHTRSQPCSNKCSC